MPTCPMCSADVDDVDQHSGETHPEAAGGSTETPAAPDAGQNAE